MQALTGIYDCSILQSLQFQDSIDGSQLHQRWSQQPIWHVLERIDEFQQNQFIAEFDLNELELVDKDPGDRKWSEGRALEGRGGAERE